MRGVFTEKMFGSEIYGAFRELKAAFDPDSVMNPGKIIDTPGIRENLRISPATRNAVVPTYLDFAKDGGLAGHVELCNSQGACRKLDGGMCPSFMVTREEEHSTRGRATMLRMIIGGQLPPSELTGKRLQDTLDLCVECKACAVECPSNVDMAALKSEVLSKYYEEHGVPLRARLFGDIARLSRIGQDGRAADEHPGQPAVRAPADGAFRGSVAQASASPVRAAPLQRVAPPSRFAPPWTPRRRRPVQRYVH